MLLVLRFTRRSSFEGTSLEMVVAIALAEQVGKVFHILLAPSTFIFGLGSLELALRFSLGPLRVSLLDGSWAWFVPARLDILFVAAECGGI